MPIFSCSASDYRGEPALPRLSSASARKPRQLKARVCASGCSPGELACAEGAYYLERQTGTSNFLSDVGRTCILPQSLPQVTVRKRCIIVAPNRTRHAPLRDCSICIARLGWPFWVRDKLHHACTVGLFATTLSVTHTRPMLGAYLSQPGSVVRDGECCRLNAFRFRRSFVVPCVPPATCA